MLGRVFDVWTELNRSNYWETDEIQTHLTSKENRPHHGVKTNDTFIKCQFKLMQGNDFQSAAPLV
jgi:hypothetical protein